MVAFVYVTNKCFKQQQMLERMQRKRNVHALLMGMYTSATIMKISMEVPQKN
jgi:hypothetical protein